MSNPSTERVVKISGCAASHPGGADMPPNQRDKLLITSGHLSVRIRPSVAQWGPAIPHNTVPQPTPAVWLNGCRCLKASVHSLSHALQPRMMSLRRLQAVQSDTWRTLNNTYFFHSSSLFGSLSNVQPTTKVYFYRHALDGFEGKNCKLFQQVPKKWKNIT